MVPLPLIILLTFIFGLCIGSFLNVLIWRLPREQKITGRSQCPNCKATLQWYELIPVVSFVWQRARCRSCGEKISPRYPLIEVRTAVLFAGLAWELNPQDWSGWVLLIRALIVAGICISIFVIDWEHYLIPDALVFPGAVIVLASNLILDLLNHTPFNFASYTISGLVTAAITMLPFWLLWRVSRGTWMGLGDVKYIGLMGLILGFPATVVGLFISFFLGSVVGIGLLLLKKKDWSSRVPFGTFLTIATVLALVWGNDLWQWYWRLLTP